MQVVRALGQFSNTGDNQDWTQPNDEALIEDKRDIGGLATSDLRARRCTFALYLNQPHGGGHLHENVHG